MDGYKTGGLNPRKYIITKTNGKPVDPKAEYFVLRIDRDPHAMKALEKYADSMKIDNEEFADDLYAKIREITGNVAIKGVLKDYIRRAFAYYCNHVSREANNTAVEHGFWETHNDGEKIALMHSELSEALESIRHGNPVDDKCPAFNNTIIELADCIIRILDFSAEYGYDIGRAVIAKMEYNKTRPFKHGKAF